MKLVWVSPVNSGELGLVSDSWGSNCLAVDIGKVGYALLSTVPW